MDISFTPLSNDGEVRSQYAKHRVVFLGRRQVKELGKDSVN
jgi:hypothetical protein